MPNNNDKNNPARRVASFAAGLAFTGLALSVGALTLASVYAGEDVSTMVKRLRDSARGTSDAEEEKKDRRDIAKRKNSLLSCRDHLLRARRNSKPQRLSVGPLTSADFHEIRGYLFSMLPSSALYECFSFLQIPDVYELGMVNKSWYSFTNILLRDYEYIERCAVVGFPDTKRFLCWKQFVGSSHSYSAMCHLYRSLCNLEDVDEALDRLIRRDLHRTMPGTELGDTEQGRAKLFRVLRAFGMYQPEIGYVQGMNYICGYLLTITDEASAFYLLDALLSEYEYFYLFKKGMPHLSMTLWQHEKLVEMFVPDVALHLREHQIPSVLYASEWFISIFSYSLELKDVGRIWDIFLVQGWPFLHKIALSILFLIQKDVLDLTFDDAVKLIKDKTRQIPIESLIEQSEKYQVTPALLDALERQYKEELWPVIEIAEQV